VVTMEIHLIKKNRNILFFLSPIGDDVDAFCVCEKKGLAKRSETILIPTTVMKKFILI
jgi:hypothetical protein